MLYGLGTHATVPRTVGTGVGLGTTERLLGKCPPLLWTQRLAAIAGWGEQGIVRAGIRVADLQTEQLDPCMQRQGKNPRATGYASWG